MYTKNYRSLQGVSRRSGQETPKSMGNTLKYGGTLEGSTRSTAQKSAKKQDIRKKYKRITEELYDDDELESPY